MKIRTVIATAALAGVAMSTTAAADTTQQRLVDYGLSAPDVGNTEVVERRQIEATSESLKRAAEYGFTAVPREEVSRSELVRQEAAERNGVEGRMADYGFLPPELAYTTETGDAELLGQQ